jgi:hypothetical protein
MKGFALALLCMGACFSPGLNDMPFHCGLNGECPPDYQCVATWCEKPGGTTIDARPADVPQSQVDSGTMCQADTFLRCKNANTAVFCASNGRDEIEQACAFACDAQQKLCEQCNPAVPTGCTGDVLQTCTPTGQLTTTTCDGWCEMGSSNATCVTLAPSNLPADSCASTTTAAFRRGDHVVIDTTLCSGGEILPQSPGTNGPPSICVYVYRDFRIDQGGVVTAQGGNALAIVGVKTMRIDGTIDVGAVGSKAGPGAVNGGVGAGKPADKPVVGGGGAGFGTNGPLGSPGSVAAPGIAYGSPTMTPLWGGSVGGRGGVDALCPVCGPSSAGGGGGGAVQIVACNALEVGDNARLLANAGGGAGGLASLAVANGSGGGGGGSGGGILVEAERLSLGGGIVVAANGGGGGGGGQGPPQGTSGEPGEDGRVGSDVAKGGPGQDPAGTGGDGGSRTASPTSGHVSNADNAGSGGSGGAVGRIRINTRAGGPISLPGSLVISPVPAIGAVARHVVP